MSVHKLYGDNLVFCHGRFIAGPDANRAAATACLIGIPSILWHVEVAPFLVARSGWLVLLPLGAAALQFAAASLLVMTAFSDPGIVPRQREYTTVYDVRTKAYRSKQPPRTFDAIVRGFPFKVKYCTTCYLYRPPRCTHCAVCENCIERFDHHCPWIGNCIGKRNYWLFYSFISTVTALTAFVLTTCIAELTILCRQFQDSHDSPPGEALLSAMGHAPLCVLNLVVTGTAIWFPLGLWLYHNYLICTNQTTYEHIKGVYSRSLNPFDRGFPANCFDVICKPVRPRFFNASTQQMLWPRAISEEARALKRVEVLKQMQPIGSVDIEAVHVEVSGGSSAGENFEVRTDGGPATPSTVLTTSTAADSDGGGGLVDGDGQACHKGNGTPGALLASRAATGDYGRHPGDKNGGWVTAKPFKVPNRSLAARMCCYRGAKGVFG